MLDPPAGPAKAWGTSGISPAVLQPLVKKRKATTNPSNKFEAPADLPRHLAISQPPQQSYQALPCSSVLFGIQIHYGRLFPYSEHQIVKLSTAAYPTAGFLNFRPYSGFFEMGFTNKDDADVAAANPVSFKGVPIPTTQTCLTNDNTIIIYIRLPTHLSPEVVRKELLEGLQAYGGHAELAFQVPYGAEHLVGPTETILFQPTKNSSPKLIPTFTALSSAVNFPFFAHIKGGNKLCAHCKSHDHSLEVCPNRNIPDLDEIILSHSIMWESLCPKALVKPRKSSCPSDSTGSSATSYCLSHKKWTAVSKKNAETPSQAQKMTYISGNS